MHALLHFTTPTCHARAQRTFKLDKLVNQRIRGWSAVVPLTIPAPCQATWRVETLCRVCMCTCVCIYSQGSCAYEYVSENVFFSVCVCVFVCVCVCVHTAPLIQNLKINFTVGPQDSVQLRMLRPMVLLAAGTCINTYTDTHTHTQTHTRERERDGDTHAHTSMSLVYAYTHVRAQGKNCLLSVCECACVW